MTVYPIGVLAEALGKSSSTIRRWERDGTLPRAPLTVPVADGPLRLAYTGEYIEGVRLMGEEEGVAGRKPADISTTRFSVRVRRLRDNLFPDLS